MNVQSINAVRFTGLGATLAAGNAKRVGALEEAENLFRDTVAKVEKRIKSLGMTNTMNEIALGKTEDPNMIAAINRDITNNNAIIAELKARLAKFKNNPTQKLYELIGNL